jgi:hypothetical protein
MSYICKYCKKSFLTENNLEKHTKRPSKKCAEIINIYNSHNKVTSINEKENKHSLQIENMNILIEIKDKEISDLQNTIKDYERRVFEYETIVEDYKSLVNDYQKDYFDCLDKYILAFKENYDLKKSLQKSSDFNQMIELKYINISKSN